LRHFHPTLGDCTCLAHKAAREGGAIRRKIRDVERYNERDTFLFEMNKRGYSIAENSGQLTCPRNFPDFDVEAGMPTAVVCAKPL
jgi:hypothetical protein